jgi:anti-sigma-K factor RskA
MDANQARDLFSEAYEGDLEGERSRAFERALAEDEALKAEYEDFVETLRMVGDLGKADDGLPPPDLLHGVQERLRKRSRGRYYRDRFAQRASMSWMLSVTLAATVLLLIGAAWYVTRSLLVEPALDEPALDTRAPDTPASDEAVDRPSRPAE